MPGFDFVSEAFRALSAHPTMAMVPGSVHFSLPVRESPGRKKNQCLILPKRVGTEGAPKMGLVATPCNLCSCDV